MAGGGSVECWNGPLRIFILLASDDKRWVALVDDVEVIPSLVPEDATVFIVGFALEH